MISRLFGDFFAIAGFNDPFLASLILSCIGLVTTIVYAFVIDKVGRRPLAITFYAFCSASLWLIGALYYSHSGATQTALVSVTLSRICLPLMWILESS